MVSFTSRPASSKPGPPGVKVPDQGGRGGSFEWLEGRYSCSQKTAQAGRPGPRGEELCPWWHAVQAERPLPGLVLVVHSLQDPASLPPGQVTPPCAHIRVACPKGPGRRHPEHLVSALLSLKSLPLRAGTTVILYHMHMISSLSSTSWFHYYFALSLSQPVYLFVYLSLAWILILLILSSLKAETPSMAGTC